MNIKTYFEENIFTEFYEIVKIYNIVMNQTNFKIEILSSINKYGEIDHFTAKCWREIEVKVDNSLEKLSNDKVMIWKKVVSFPWINRDTESSATAQALSFLSEKYQK